VTILENTITYQKELIDSIIYEIADSRVNYIFRTFNPYQRLIKFLDSGNEETKDAVLKHRFYVEYKIKDVISSDR
jgi:hypothetical protein